MACSSLTERSTGRYIDESAGLLRWGHLGFKTGLQLNPSSAALPSACWKRFGALSLIEVHGRGCADIASKEDKYSISMMCKRFAIDRCILYG